MLPLIPLILDLAPTVAGWIMGDKTGKAVAQVSDIAKKVIGTDNPDDIAKAIAQDPNLALQFKTALIAAEGQERQRQHDEVMAQIADISSARNQTIELAKAGSPLAWGAALISVLVLVTFGCVLYFVLTKQIPEGQNEVAMYMLGTLSTMAAGVVSYWVGSSQGSTQKTALLGAKPKG